MASGGGSVAEEQPPALPVKQRRRSSMESDCTPLSPVGPRHQNYAYNDVFPEPTDCHAAQCPIHQRYDPCRHQARFFSDGTPPPVPKKRLARTVSLPGNNAPSLSPWSPLSPLRRGSLKFDNPLYMMAPIPDASFHDEAEEFTESPVLSASFSQLSFDTPDEHLPFHFSTFLDQSVISQGIQHRHLLFLRSMAQRVEAGQLRQGEAGSQWGTSLYQPQDFLLREGSRPKKIGDMVYYSVHSPKFPGRLLGLTIHKKTSTVRTSLQPPHVNVQDIIAHFHPRNMLRNKSNTVESQGATAAPVPPPSECTPAEQPGGGITECVVELQSASAPTIQCFLLKGHSVRVERDLPHATLEDFVQESCSLQSSRCLDYDRRVCVLLLQVIMGSHHLYKTSAAAAELRPQEVLLVWPDRESDSRKNKERRGASDGTNDSNTSRQREDQEGQRMEEEGRIQALWKADGPPRVLLKTLSSSLPVQTPLTAITNQIRALIQFCQQPQESQRNPDVLPTMHTSWYHRGLLYLRSLLQGESGPWLADMAALLQVLLWGPHHSFFNDRSITTTAVHNWLTIKRALLVMKLAERGLIQEESALSWEDCMCLQYLSSTDSETVVSVATQLRHALNTDQDTEFTCGS